MLGPASRSLKRSTRKLRASVHPDNYNIFIKNIQCRRTFATTYRSQTDALSESTSRERIWSLDTHDILPETRRGTSVAQHNLQLAKCADSEDFIGALQQCKNMKDNGIKPDINTYNYLLDACSRVGMGAEAFAIFEDMQLVGIPPNRQTFHSLINAQRRTDSQTMWDAIDKMIALGVPPTPHTYTFIISRYLLGGSFEVALQLFMDMTERGLLPQLKAAQGVILLAAQLGYPKLSLGLIKIFEENAARSLGSEVWMSCLIASAQDLYVDGVTRCWDVIVHQLKLLPDEGVCIEVLHTGARHGLPNLAGEVIEVLKQLGANLQEYHFAALIEAHCRAGQVEDAILTLDDMRSQDVRPLPATASAITVAVGTDIGSLDAALSMMDDLHKQGKRIDVEALNAIIQAATSLGDLQRAIGIYKAFGDYDADPTVETFNLLLAGCTASCHREFGDRLIAEMKQAKLKPNAQTYENIIALCLTQEIYEDAFFYLEEMKSAKHVPPSTIYKSLTQKCLLFGDSRYQLVLEEMEQCGYRVPMEESRRGPKDR